MNAKLIVILTVCWMVFGTLLPAQGEDSSLLPSETTNEMQPIQLDALIQSAMERNPSILRAKAEWLAEKKQVVIDASLPDPEGGYDIMGSMVETRVGPQKNRFAISQNIPFPLKLWQQALMADSEAKAAYQRYLAVRRDVINELKKLFYDLYLVDSSIASINETKDLLKKFESIASLRYSNLSGTQRDVAKAQAEVSMSLERLFSLTQQKQSLSAQMNALLDRDPMLSLGTLALDDAPKLEQSLVELVNLAVLNRFEIKEMELLVKKSEHAKTLAKLQNIPDINVGFEYVRVGPTGMNPPDEDGRDSWMVPISMNLPVWQNRIIPEIQKAQNMIDANQARLVEARNQAYYEVKDAYYRFDSASKIAELYETAVLPQAQLALNSDQAGYEAGKVDFLNLLDSERIYISARLNLIRMQTEARKSFADLVRASGLDLEAESIAVLKESVA